MNIVIHHTVKLEFDVWEPHEKKAREEYDRAVAAFKATMSHVGNLRIMPVSEERVNEKI